MDRLHSAGATTISLDSFRRLGSSYVPVRGHTLFDSPSCIFNVLDVRTCVWVYEVGFLHVALGLVNFDSRTWSVYLPQGPTNAMHVFVRRATCIKSLSTRGPGRSDTCYLTDFSQTFTDD